MKIAVADLLKWVLNVSLVVGLIVIPNNTALWIFGSLTILSLILKCLEPYLYPDGVE